jgi:hypothetical protein
LWEKYQFKQLGDLVRNWLEAYIPISKPDNVKQRTVLKFNLTVYSKIIEILYPEISIGTNTVVKGNINSDIKEFKLNFTS